MENANMNLIYSEIKKLRKEVHELRMIIVPEESLSQKEQSEVNEILADMNKGNEKNWRELKK